MLLRPGKALVHIEGFGVPLTVPPTLQEYPFVAPKRRYDAGEPGLGTGRGAAKVGPFPLSAYKVDGNFPWDDAFLEAFL